jgi:hypothetical protein
MKWEIMLFLPEWGGEAAQIFDSKNAVMAMMVFM